jgi:hypothetical protein
MIAKLVVVNGDVIGYCRYVIVRVHAIIVRKNPCGL